MDASAVFLRLLPLPAPLPDEGPWKLSYGKVAKDDER